MRTDPPHRAKRSLGQNFLVDPNLQRKIAQAVDPGPGDRVLEIGPGKGALTRHLAGQVASLTLVELDDALAARLQEVYAGWEGVRVIHGDVLRLSLPEVDPDPPTLKVVGNIPYNITAPILFHLLDRPRPREIVLMVQKEVADRIVAEPGSRAYGALAVGVRTVAEAERLFNVPPGAFRPVPKVDSTVIRIRPLDPPPLTEAEESSLRVLTRAAFGRRRKQLQRILRDAPEFGLAPEELTALGRELSMDLTQRPERLSPERFIHLSRALSAQGYPRP